MRDLGRAGFRKGPGSPRSLDQKHWATIQARPAAHRGVAAPVLEVRLGAAIHTVAGDRVAAHRTHAENVPALRKLVDRVPAAPRAARKDFGDRVFAVRASDTDCLVGLVRKVLVVLGHREAEAVDRTPAAEVAVRTLAALDRGPNRHSPRIAGTKRGWDRLGQGSWIHT